MKTEKKRKVNPIKTPKSPEVKYRNQLIGLTVKLRRDVTNNIIPLLRRLQPEYINDAYAKTLEEAFNRLRSMYVNVDQNARIVSESFVNNSNQVNKQRFYKSIESAVGVNLQSIVQNEDLEDILVATTRENVALIRSIPEEYFKKIETIVFTGTTQGNTATSMIQQIQKTGKTTTNRAKLIARDQSSKLNSALTQQRSQNLGVEEYVWRTAGDERVRESHRSKNGKVFRWDDPPKDTGHPGQDIQCFTGDVKVGSFGLVKKLFRRSYIGELTFFVTESKTALRSTPNHLHLTSRGWVAAKDIEVGDYVLDTIDHSFNGIETYSKNIISFEDLFNTINMFILRVPSWGSEVQFHGDGIIDKQVDIIDFESELLNTIEPVVRKQLEEFIFTWTKSSISNLVGSSDFNFVLGRFFSSSSSFVSFSSKLFSIFNRSIFHAIEHNFTSSPDRYFIFDEKIPDSLSFCSGEFRDIINSVSSEIPIDDQFVIELLRIISRAIMSWYGISGFSEFSAEDIRIDLESFSSFFKEKTGINKIFSRVEQVGSVNYSGHVYNLENNLNYYLADNVLTHNCRCVAQPIIKV